MQEKKNGRKLIVIVIVIFAVVSGLLLGLSHLNINGNDARKTVMGDKVVTKKDIMNDAGKFVILDYPEYDVTKCVKLADYKNFVAHVAPLPEITEADIDENIESYILYYQRFDRVESGTVHKGDIIEVSYQAYDDGQLVSGYSATNGKMILGESDEPAEFVEAFDGIDIGKSVEFDVTFGEDWADETVQNHTLHFKGSVSAILKPIELSDETVSVITDGQFDTEQAFRDYIRDEIAEYDKTQYEGEISTQIAEFLSTESTFKTIPDSLIKWFVSMEMKYYQDMADSYKMSVEEYLEYAGIESNVDDLIYSVAQNSLPMIQRYVALTAVAQAEGIVLDDTNPDDKALIDQRYEEIVSGLGLEDNAAADRYYKRSNIYNDALNWKTLDWLIHNVQVSDPVENVESGE